MGAVVANLPLKGDGRTVTVSTPLIDLTQTWNAGGVTFTGWKLNVTDTASAAASKLIDLQVGGSTMFSVNKIGAGTFANTLTFATEIVSSSTAFRFGINNTHQWQINSGGSLIASADNASDIGASGANRPRGLYLAGGITHGSATLLSTTTALTNGAGAGAGTITNAPAAGNPTKWIPISDNGTTRYIPAW